MERLGCRPIGAHYSEQTAECTHLVNLARKEKERKRKGGDGKPGEKKEGRHGWSLSGTRGLSLLMNCSLSEKKWQNRSYNLAMLCTSCALQTTASKLVRQNASGIHQNGQRLWLRLGVNIDDQLWLHLNPIPIPNCNRIANPNPNRPTTPLQGLLILTDPFTSK